MISFIKSFAILCHGGERVSEITWLSLLVGTRDEDHAQSSNGLRLFSGSDEIATFAKPPSAGKQGWYGAAVKLDYDDLIGAPMFLGLTGTDRWAPRSAFVYGWVDTGGGSRTIPLAENIRPLPINPFVSQDTSEGQDRWPLTTISEAGSNTRLRVLLLVMRTRNNQSAQSKGPFELSVYGDSNGLPVLVYQTTLAPVAKQAPGEKNAHYFVDLQVFQPRVGFTFTSSDLRTAVLTNRSEDAWMANQVFMFGLNPEGNVGRYLGGRRVGWWISQDPHDSPNNSVRALATVEFSLS